MSIFAVYAHYSHILQSLGEKKVFVDQKNKIKKSLAGKLSNQIGCMDGQFNLV